MYVGKKSWVRGIFNKILTDADVTTDDWIILFYFLCVFVFIFFKEKSQDYKEFWKGSSTSPFKPLLWKDSHNLINSLLHSAWTAVWTHTHTVLSLISHFFLNDLIWKMLNILNISVIKTSSLTFITNITSTFSGKNWISTKAYDLPTRWN